jgi:VWFA-related protein
MRVQRTLDAFRSIAQHVAGYPGRKNLLWISSSFPLALFPDSDFKFVGMSEYQDEFVELGKALSDAKIAIYPMDAGGLQAQSFFEASARPTARNAAVGTATSATMMREESSRSANQDSMSQLATETGGRVCVNNNDLADCVKKGGLPRPAHVNCNPGLGGTHFRRSTGTSEILSRD